MVIFRIESNVDVLLNIVLYHAEILAFMTIHHLDFSIRWTSGKPTIRFVTSMTARKLSFNIVLDRDFQ